MIKLIIILGVVVYILFKVSSFFFKIGAASQHMRQNQDAKTKKAPDPKIKGGDYVDYEEVK
jgi:hypothetical protein